MRYKITNFFNNLKSRMLYGKYGMDELSRFHMSAALIPLLISLCTTKLANGYVSLALYIIAMTSIVWSLWRAFSSKRDMRARENQHFTSGAVYSGLRDFAVRFSQRKQYKFFKCPGCKKRLRVPKGKGKIEITCPFCHTKFQKST